MLAGVEDDIVRGGGAYELLQLVMSPELISVGEFQPPTCLTAKELGKGVKNGRKQRPQNLLRQRQTMPVSPQLSRHLVMPAP